MSLLPLRDCVFAGRNSVTSHFPSRLGERLETIEAVKAGRTSHHSGIRLPLDGRKVGRGGVGAVGNRT